MRTIISAAILAAGLIGLAASSQAAPVSGPTSGIATTETSIVPAQMSRRARIVRHRMVRQRIMKRRAMRRGRR